MSRELIIAAGAETIYYRKLRRQLAPGYATLVHSTVEKISQVFSDATGNKIHLTVGEYNNAINRAITIFMDDKVWPFNVAKHFVDKLDEPIKAEFEK